MYTQVCWQDKFPELELLGQNISPLGLPWWSSGEDSVLSLQAGWV